MIVTVRKLLKVLPDISVYAGEGGMDKVVQAISFIDAPSSVDWLNGGEIILTTAFLYKENEEMQLRFVQKLIEMGTVALGIKIGRYVDKIPDSILKLANENNFPIFKIGFDMVWSEIFSAFYSLRLDKKDKKSVLSTELVTFDKLIRSSNWDSEAIRMQFLKCINAPAVIVNDSYHILSKNNDDDDETELKSIEKYCRKMQRLCADGERAGRFVSPAEQGSRLFDYMLYPGERIVLFSDSEDIQETEIEWISALYRKIRKKNRFMQDVSTLWRNFIDECLVRGSEENLVDYIRILNLQEGTPKVLLIFSGPMAIAASDEVKRLCRSELAKKEIVLNVAVMSDEKVVILYEKKEPDPQFLLTGLRGIIRKSLGKYPEVRVGIGKCVLSPKDVKKSYQCAESALCLGRSIYPEEKLILYEDISLFEMLQQDYDIRLIHYLDKAITTFNSCKTLQTYLECGNIKRAAECLFIHDNTMRYRIQKIEQLLNVDLNEPLVRISLLIKVKLWFLANRGDNNDQ